MNYMNKLTSLELHENIRTWTKCVRHGFSTHFWELPEEEISISNNHTKKKKIHQEIE